MAENTKRETSGTSSHGRSKRKYKRTTPIGRVGRNIEKTSRILGYSLGRLETWSKFSTGADSKKLAMLVDEAREIVVGLGRLNDDVKALAKKGFVPPKKTTLAVVFSVGDEVKVGAKYLDKYQSVYPVAGLRTLVVDKILPSGEIAVSSEKAHIGPILIAKSRLEKR